MGFDRSHDRRLRPRRPRLRLPRPGRPSWRRKTRRVHLPSPSWRTRRRSAREGNTGLALRVSATTSSPIPGRRRGPGGPARAITKSTCLSADVNAAFDPNYRLRCLRGRQLRLPQPGRGASPSTPAPGARAAPPTPPPSLWARCAKSVDERRRALADRRAGQGGPWAAAAPWPCISADLNVDVIDVGVPVLSMHAPFEVVSKLDVYMAYKGFKAYFEAE